MTVFDHDRAIDDGQVDRWRIAKDQRGDRIAERAGHSQAVQPKSDDISRFARRDLPDVIPPQYGSATASGDAQRFASGQRGRIAQRPRQ